MTDTDTLLARIAKLLRLAERSDQPGEAAAAAEAAQRLAERHHIEISSVNLTDGTAAPVISEQTFGLPYRNYLWQVSLAGVIAHHGECRIVFHRGIRGRWSTANPSVVFIGAETLRPAVMTQWAFVRDRLARAAAHDRPRDRTAYFAAAVSAVRQRLAELKAQRHAQYANSERALVVSAGTEADQYMRTKWPRMRNTSPWRMRQVDTRSYEQGISAGRSVSLGREIGGGV